MSSNSKRRPRRGDVALRTRPPQLHRVLREGQGLFGGFAAACSIVPGPGHRARAGISSSIIPQVISLPCGHWTRRGSSPARSGCIAAKKAASAPSGCPSRTARSEPTSSGRLEVVRRAARGPRRLRTLSEKAGYSLSSEHDEPGERKNSTVRRRSRISSSTSKRGVAVDQHQVDRAGTTHLMSDELRLDGLRVAGLKELHGHPDLRQMEAALRIAARSRIRAKIWGWAPCTASDRVGIPTQAQTPNPPRRPRSGSPRAELLHPDTSTSAGNGIGEFWSYPQARLAELLIDCEEDRTLQAVLVRMLQEAERGHGQLPLGSVL